MRSHCLFSGATFIQRSDLKLTHGRTVEYRPSKQILAEMEEGAFGDKYQYIYTGQGQHAEQVDAQLHKSLREQNIPAWYTREDVAALPGVDFFVLPKSEKNDEGKEVKAPSPIDAYVDANKHLMEQVSTETDAVSRLRNIEKERAEAGANVAFAGLSNSLAEHRFKGLFA